MTKKLLFIIPIITLCFSCSNEPSFFTGNIATEQEVLSYFSKVDTNYNFVPDGWYKYEKIRYHNDKEVAVTTLTFYLDSYADLSGNMKYLFPELIGKHVLKDVYTIEYKGSDDKIFVKGSFSNSTTGASNAQFKVEDLLFSSVKGSNYTFYLSGNSIHCEEITDKKTVHIGINYSDDFKKIESGLVISEENVYDDVYYKFKTTIKSCNPVKIEINEDYEQMANFYYYKVKY